MRRRDVLGGSASAAAWPLILHAQPSTKVPRVGYLAPTFENEARDRVDIFRQTLRRLGHFEGQNVIIDYRFAEGDSVGCLKSPPSFSNREWT